MKSFDRVRLTELGLYLHVPDQGLYVGAVGIVRFDQGDHAYFLPDELHGKELPSPITLGWPVAQHQLEPETVEEEEVTEE